MKKLKKIPIFQNEADERKFWAKHDSTEYVDWDKGVHNRVFSNLKPSTKTISLRLPVSLLEKIKTEANKRDIPYQSYMKAVLARFL
jgi:predicted DNA binding CopG/RHH family protein